VVLVVETIGGGEHEDRHATAAGDDASGDLVTGGPGNVPVENGDVVRVEVQQLQRGVAVTGDVGRDRFQAEAIADGVGQIGLVLDEQHTHASRLGPAHIARVSKTAYVPATPRCLQWRRDPQQTGTSHDPADPDAQAACRRRARRHRGDRRSSRLPVAGAVALHGLLAVVVGRIPVDRSRNEQRDALGEADGAVPDGTTVFDDEVAGVANLDPALLGALRQAATDAAGDGVEFVVDSGWRSPEYQERLLREAVAKYGSAQEAARWVATPHRSAHVSATRSTSGPPLPRRGCPHTAPPTGCAGSTATNPGTTSCARKLSLAVARPRTPTPRRTQGCSGSREAPLSTQPRTHGPNMTRKPRTLAALGLIALTGAGCANESAGSGSTGTAGKKATDRDKAVKFAECMRENGVSDFPDPTPKGDFEYGVSVSPAVWKKAVGACKALQPPGTLDAKRTRSQQSAALEFAQCVRENGVKDFPDPANGEPLIDTTRIPSTARSGGMTILNAATHKCGDLLDEAARGRR
jgi:hypothetical protein